MEYRLSYEYSFKQLLELNRVHGRTHLKWMHVILKILGWVLFGVLLACTAVLLISDGWQNSCAMFIIVALLIAVLEIFGDHLNALSSKSLLVKGLGTLELSVTDDGVYAKSAKGEERYYFTAATALYKRHGTYYMYIDKRHALILPEDAFTMGEPSTFGDYLSKKCGLPVKILK